MLFHVNTSSNLQKYDDQWLDHEIWVTLTYTNTGLTSSDFLLYFLKVECQAKEQLVPFLKSLVRLGRE